MGTVDDLGEAVERKTRRVLAVLLSFKEQECDDLLPSEVRAAFRKLILDQVNELGDLAIDCVKTASMDAGVINQIYVETLEKIHENTEALLSVRG